MNSKYHVPVLLKESINGLNILPNGVYVDATFGGGSHTKEILNHLNSSGKVIAFDQDADAIENQINDNRLKLIKSNFKYLTNHLKYLKINKIDGLLADFGISSYQIDTQMRGFSIRFDSDLDMRMNKDQKKDAKHILNKYCSDDLNYIFKNFGELKNYKKVTQIIISQRSKQRIVTTGDLIRILKPISPLKNNNKFLAKIFQAIRIEVNDELSVIKKLLEASSQYLNKGGRLVCISYHSLEDRLVKRYIQNGSFNEQVESDIYGHKNTFFKKIGKIVTPSEDELNKNKRSRSAKLRIAEKNMKNFLSFINIDFLAGKDSRKNWRMLMFISFLIMTTIYSSHSADQKVFKISELNKEVNNLNNISVSTKIQLMNVKMESKVTSKLNEQGFYPSNNPPVKIIIRD
jgi:16S rRNA (cytosine1402-N4)-methyltransferase